MLTINISKIVSLVWKEGEKILSGCTGNNTVTEKVVLDSWSADQTWWTPEKVLGGKSPSAEPQRSTGLKTERFICGPWSSLKRLSLAYLTPLCPPAHSCDASLSSPHPDIVQSRVLANLPAECHVCVSHLGAQRQVDHDARGCLLRLLQVVLGALQSVLSSQ